MALSNRYIKLINSLSIRKYRKKHQIFIAEGSKLVLDLINADMEIESIFATQEWIDEKKEISANISQYINIVNEQEIKKISKLSSPSSVFALFKYQHNVLNGDIFDQKRTILFCDEIQDPGNLGSLIRSADWFGIDTIVCTKNSADCYNPKTIQASMGSIARVKVFYCEIDDFFGILPEEYHVLGAYMEGEDVSKFPFKKESVLIIGNEGKGISLGVEKYINHKISLPQSKSPNKSSQAESLNASVAGSIILYELSKHLK